MCIDKSLSLGGGMVGNCFLLCNCLYPPTFLFLLSGKNTLTISSKVHFVS